ncbi:MAG: polysaccharide deacetylase family protein, partial [Nakamurella sp.]
MYEHSARRAPRLFGLAGVVSAASWTMLSSRSQLLGPFPFRGARSERVIALTFDDGPNEPFTTQIGDFLAGKAIKATFFQVGRCVERFPDATAALVRQGHVIGNHSYSHEFLQCVRPRAQRAQTQAAQHVLTQVIGRTPALYRPPWLLRTPALYATLRHHNLQPISGEFCHPFEVFQPNPQRIAERALAKVRPGSILIFHDGFDSRGGNRANTVEAVKIVVNELLREGYLFVTVDDLL